MYYVKQPALRTNKPSQGAALVRSFLLWWFLVTPDVLTWLPDCGAILQAFTLTPVLRADLHTVSNRLIMLVCNLAFKAVP